MSNGHVPLRTGWAGDRIGTHHIPQREPSHASTPSPYSRCEKSLLPWRETQARTVFSGTSKDGRRETSRRRYPLYLTTVGPHPKLGKGDSGVYRQKTTRSLSTVAQANVLVRRELAVGLRLALDTCCLRTGEPYRLSTGVDEPQVRKLADLHPVPYSDDRKRSPRCSTPESGAPSIPDRRTRPSSGSAALVRPSELLPSRRATRSLRQLDVLERARQHELPRVQDDTA